jgi:fibronectin-binding autotransporter adhesin
MKTNYFRTIRSTVRRNLQISGWIPAALCIIAMLCCSSIPAFGQTWIGSTSDLWTTGTNWSGNTSPNSSSAVVTISSTANNPVQLNANTSISTLAMGASTSLDITAGTLSVFGTSISNAGSISLDSLLQLANNVTLSGAGTMTLAGGQIGTNGTAYTLTNSSTIAGYGTIGSNQGADYPYVSLNNSGTINANSNANTLYIAGSGTSFTNSGTLAATAGGILDIAVPDPINDSGGKITASGSGSTVEISSTIQGGTLKTAGGGLMETIGTATLDGSTQGAITLADGSTYTGGGSTTTSLVGTLNLGTSTGSTLALTGNLQLTGNATISGPGSITMTGGQIGTNGTQYALTNSSVIQGYGEIGSNNGSDYPYLSLANGGTIDANSSGNTLEIGGSGTSITNTGLFEATNGGTLLLNTTATILNSGANITANGAGSTVSFDNVTVQGGTLSGLNGGILQTIGSSTLDASTSGPMTLADGSTYTAGTNTTTSLVGTLKLGTSTGSTLALTGNLRLTGDATVSGPGAINMTGGQIGTSGTQYTLTNESTIQGYGLIGSNVGSDYPYLSMVNSGTINSNVSGDTLTLGGSGTSWASTGVIEATGGGTLVVAPTNPLDNQGGVLKATGAGSTVEISDATIQGGTLTTSNGGVMETASGNATLDGSTHGAITLSDGSTYTAGTTALTAIVGTLNLGTSTGSNFALTGQLSVTGNTTLSGPGTLTMTNTTGENPYTAQIGTNGSSYTLTNDSTIQGAGIIGSNTGALYDYVSLTNNGTVNATGGTLTIAGNSTTTTNNGTMAVQTGSTLAITDAFSNFNSGTSTLTGGTYNINGGTFQFNNANIVTNAADIILAGAGSQIVDQNNNNALANFATNAAGGIFQLGAGRSFTTAGNFTNNGSLIVGSGDLFKVTGSLTNFASSTLTGGSYFDAGTLQFGASGTGITTNDAKITLSTAGWSMINLGGGNLLTNLATNESGASFTVANNASFTSAGAFANSGALDVENGGTLKVAGALTNSGTVSTNGTNQGGAANTLTVAGRLTNSGSGAVEIGENNDTSDVANVGLLANSGTVTVGTGATLNLIADGANTSSGAITVDGGTLDMQAGSFANSSTIDLEQKGTLTITGNLTNNGTITTNNANLGGGANTITVTGQLTNETSGSVTIGAHNDTSDVANLGIVYNQGAITVDKGATLNLTTAGTDFNLGTITVTNGTLSLATGAQLDMEQGGKLAVTGPLTNAGSITTNGANEGGSPNTVTVSGKVTNNAGATISIGEGNDTSDTATFGSIANSGTVTVGTGATLTLSTAAANTSSGTLDVDGTLDSKGSITLSGTGALTLTGGSLTATGTGETLKTGAHNTISGAGTISGFGITNAGTLSANQASPLIFLPSTAGLTNTGTIAVSAGDTMQIGTSGGGVTLTNLSGTTLTGGTYNLTGTLQFGASGTTIATNAANITLTGSGEMEDFGGNNILAGFNNNASTGVFKLASGASLTTTGGSFTNAGLFTVAAGTTFTVGGSSFNFTQTAGTTSVSGTLTSSTLGTLAVDGGSLFGSGTLGYNVVDASVLSPGASVAGTGKLTVADTYTQDSTGALDIAINGATAGTKYDQLKVTQGATLGGTLNISLGAGFTPTVGQTFTILTASSVSDTFATVNGLAINGSEHFTITYHPGSVVLTVVSGALTAATPASLLVTQLIQPVLHHSSVAKGHYGLEVIGRGFGQHPAVVAPVTVPAFSMARVPQAASISAPVSLPVAFGHPAMGVHGFRPMDDFGSPSAAPVGAVDATGSASSLGISAVSAASYNSMGAMNHMRFECGVDLKGLLKTSRKQLLKGLWASPDSKDALWLGYVNYTTSH